MSEVDPTVRLVVERLDDLRKDFGNLREQLTNQANSYVHRDVWLQRNEHVNSELRSQGREISNLRADVQSKRMPWTQVVTSITSIIAILLATGLIGK